MCAAASNWTKRNKIIYWVSTLWLALGMVATGMVQLLKVEAEGAVAPPGVYGIKYLGYPIYFLTILGIWKILGVVAVLIPKFPLIKEWAYAGFFFVMTGAVFSHLANGDAANELLGPALLLILTGVSWYFRPAERKVAFSESRKEKYEQCEDHKREVVA
jgi:DoxX-like family